MNGNPILKVKLKDGSTIIVTYDQALAKYYHSDTYDLKYPKDFDFKRAQSLPYKEKLAYLRKMIPREYVIEFQIANAKSLSARSKYGDYHKIPGFIGPDKKRGHLYIWNEGQEHRIHFIDERTNLWRSTVLVTEEALRVILNNGFWLFPTGGN